MGKYEDPPKIIDPHLLKQAEGLNIDVDSSGQKRADQAQMLLFLAALARGMSPFEAARHAGRPLSYWRGLAQRNPEFAMAYEGALVDCGHAMASESLHIADKADPSDVAVARLRTQVRMKLAKAFAPETFGEKVDVTNKQVRVRRTEFVSYFGIREMKQGEASEDEVVRIIESGGLSESTHEQRDGEGTPRLGQGPSGQAPDEVGVPADEEGLPPDEPEGHEAGEEGDTRRAEGRRRLDSLTDEATSD